jgi:hypothetical protein
MQPGLSCHIIICRLKYDLSFSNQCSLFEEVMVLTNLAYLGWPIRKGSLLFNLLDMTIDRNLFAMRWHASKELSKLLSKWQKGWMTLDAFLATNTKTSYSGPHWWRLMNDLSLLVKAMGPYEEATYGISRFRFCIVSNLPRRHGLGEKEIKRNQRPQNSRTKDND